MRARPFFASADRRRDALGAALALMCGMPTIDAQAKSKRDPSDPRTQGIGRSCKRNADCAHRSQVCLKESDANGKELQQGICALPCAAIDAGMAPPQLDAKPETEPAPKKVFPPRCPKKFQCRSAGAGVPIDLCIKE